MVLTAHQHLMMEALLGCELTRAGRPRTNKRNLAETTRLGLYTVNTFGGPYKRTNARLEFIWQLRSQTHVALLKSWLDTWPHYEYSIRYIEQQLYRPR